MDVEINLIWCLPKKQLLSLSTYLYLWIQEKVKEGTEWTMRPLEWKTNELMEEWRTIKLRWCLSRCLITSSFLWPYQRASLIMSNWNWYSDNERNNEWKKIKWLVSMYNLNLWTKRPLLTVTRVNYYWEVKYHNKSNNNWAQFQLCLK